MGPVRSHCLYSGICVPPAASARSLGFYPQLPTQSFCPGLCCISGVFLTYPWSSPRQTSSWFHSFQYSSGDWLVAMLQLQGPPALSRFHWLSVLKRIEYRIISTTSFISCCSFLQSPVYTVLGSVIAAQPSRSIRSSSVTSLARLPRQARLQFFLTHTVMM